MTNALVTFTRAPKGGAVSPVNGQRYEGGQWMPIHGESAASEKRKAKASGARITFHWKLGRIVIPAGFVSLDVLFGGGSPAKTAALDADVRERILASCGRTQAQLEAAAEMESRGIYITELSAWDI